MIKKIETGLFVFIIILVIGVSVLAGININKNSQENKADRDSLAVETNIAKETAKKEGFTSSEQKSTDIISESDAGQEVQTESKKDYSIMCMEAYKQALANLHDFMILPDNRTITSDTNIEQNRYAIVDIDNDGKEELIFSYTDTSIATMAMYIYGYDENAESIYMEMKFYVTAEIYDSGYVKELYSHNIGVDPYFWPYTLYKYNEEQDSFDKIGSVETRNSENENYSDYDIGTKITIEYKNLTPDNYE